VIIDHGRLVAESALDELASEDASLEDVFLKLTAGRLS
jgi:hypothetical protein